MKTILITGCSSGIGNALARAFNRYGDRVIATARNPKSLATLEAEGCITLPLDVTDESSVESLTKTIQSDFGHLDMLINNAGIAEMGPVSELPISRLRQQLETNVVAPTALIQRLLPLIQESQQPMIVNIGSVSDLLTTPFAGAYCASKAAFNALSDALRMELQPLGITVVNVQPGKISSALGDNATAAVDGWLNAQSRYWPIKDAIYARATAQQEGATSADDFAETCVQTLDQRNPPAIIRIGNHSRLIPFLKRWAPTSRLDGMLSKKFSLDLLAK